MGGGYTTPCHPGPPAYPHCPVSLPRLWREENRGSTKRKFLYARVKGGAVYPWRLWSRDGAELLGQGVSGAAVFGQQYGRRRRGVPLVSKAISHRDLFFRPEKSRFPYS